MEEVVEGKDYSFPAEEEKTLSFWNDINAFHEQLKRTEGKPEYVFYDGPPFATGLPHYGHLLAGTIKDIVTRYASTTGYHVTRRFGWDCHGLPVEYEIDKKLGIKARDDVLKLGIANYNEECRSIVMRYSKEWEKTVTRIGRWIDFEHDYKTMNPSFMESVWWVFKQLHTKGLVYKGFKVMPYSTGCSTALSNFEAGLNYKEVSDPAVMVSFQLDDDPDEAALVAWTTTPWTLPSNLALCVNPEFEYVRARDTQRGRVFIVAESRLASVPGAVVKAKKGKKMEGEEPKGWQILGKMKGSELKGRGYTPLFPYFSDMKGTGAFRVVADAYVTADSGTGVVHCAPAFGEDDYRVCLANGIIGKGDKVPCPVDESGRFTQPVADFQGRYVKDADKDIIHRLKNNGSLVDHANEVHSYPFCWRSDQPLIYKAVPSWFVAVEPIKERLLANNDKTYWVPSYVKEKRFHNWLENAHDWAVSRSRFWGTPIPIWISSDGEEIVVVGSVAELEELSGHKVTDLHRHFIDHITIPSKQGKGDLRRVDDVFDCWFESGSMPYAYIHYPFENKQFFEDNFPADFVAEGLDQTRGWFYTLMVISTALFDKPAFKHLVCNGLVLAADGKKMSKSLQNYPDPMLVIGKYGADAIRLYLINSPVVRAETLKFQENGVKSVVKDVFLPWYNAYRFLVQNVLRLKVEAGVDFDPAKVDLSKATNVLDRWINAASRHLTKFVHDEMSAYRLYTVVPYLVSFIEELTNIYVRYNRKRLKGRTGSDDCLMALASLFSVVLTLAKVMSPFTPFFTETMYQNLRKILPDSPASVHFCDMPPSSEPLPGDEQIQASVERMQRVIELARTIRERHNKPLKLPLRELVVVHTDTHFLEDLQGELCEYVTEEMNVHSLVTCSDQLKHCTLKGEPEWQVLGKKLGKSMGAVGAAIKQLTADQILQYEAEGKLTVSGYELGPGELKVRRDFKPPEGDLSGDVDANGDGEVLVVLDLRVDTHMLAAGMAREVVNRVQKLRKKAGLVATDSVDVFYEIPNGDNAANGAVLSQLIHSESAYIAESLGVPALPSSLRPPYAVVLADEMNSVGGEEMRSDVKITLTKPAIALNKEAILKAAGGNQSRADGIGVWLASRNLASLQKEASDGVVRVNLDGEALSLAAGTHFFWRVTDAVAN